MKSHIATLILVALGSSAYGQGVQSPSAPVATWVGLCCTEQAPFTLLAVKVKHDQKSDVDFWTTRFALPAQQNPQAAPPPSELHWIFSLKDYWFAIVGAFIGSFLAIIFTKRDQRVKERADRGKYVARLVRCLSFNVDRLKQAKTQFTESVIPNYPMDTEQLNDWIAQAGDLLDEKLMEAVDWQRYQLDHVSSKILEVSQYNLHIAVAANPTPDQNAFRDELVANCERHVDTILRELPPIIEQLKQVKP